MTATEKFSEEELKKLRWIDSNDWASFAKIRLAYEEGKEAGRKANHCLYFGCKEQPHFCTLHACAKDQKEHWQQQARQEALEEAIETARITIHGKQENPCYCWGCDQSVICEWEKLNEALQALKSKERGEKK